MNAKLLRTLNYPQVATYGIGAILGAGIYALVGKIVGVSGVMAPLSFLLSAVLASFTAYSYTQLVKYYPRSAGEAEYVFQGFKHRGISNIIGWLVAFTGMVSAATLINGFVGYFQDFLPWNDSLIIVLITLLTLLLTIKGIKESVGIIMLITFVEVAGLLIICFAASGALIEEQFLFPQMIESFEWSKLTPIFSGAFLAFYAFIGFEDMVNLAEETKVAEKTLSKAIITALVVATSLYIIVSLAAISALPVEVIKESKSPLSDMYEKYGGNPKLISAIGIFAIFNGIVASMIMSSRILYGMRHSYEKLKALSVINPKTQTPIVATIFVSIAILILTLAFPIQTLAESTSFVILLVFTVVNLALVQTEIRSKSHKYANIIIPSVGAVLNVAFLIFKIQSFF